MVRKFELIRELPGIEKGITFEFDDDSDEDEAIEWSRGSNNLVFTVKELQEFTDWFREIIPPRFNPTPDQKFYYVGLNSPVSSGPVDGETDFRRLHYKNGNCFKTLSDAWEAQRRQYKLFMDLHKELAEQ